MSGYQEAMTDPSYAGQLITFTYPHDRQLRRLGRGDGVRPRPRARGDHAGRDRPRRRAGSERGWLGWLRDCGIPAISGVDTRALVRHIRDAGAMRGGVFPADLDEAEARALIDAEPSMTGRDLARGGDAAPSPWSLEGGGPARGSR